MPCVTLRSQDLYGLGPLISVDILVSSAYGALLQQEEKTAPSPIRLQMLIDTGASVSAIQVGVAQKLGVKQHSIINIATPSSSCHACPQYDVDLAFPNHRIIVPNIRVIESDFTAQGIGGLIGRDVLKSGLFVFSGYDDTFILSF